VKEFRVAIPICEVVSLRGGSRRGKDRGLSSESAQTVFRRVNDIYGTRVADVLMGGLSGGEWVVLLRGRVGNCP